MSIATLTGRVHYLTREAMPPVTLKVELWINPPADAKATLLASTMRRVPHGGSLAYTLEYDRTELVEGQTYSVTASVYYEGRLHKTTHKDHPVNLPETTQQDIEVHFARPTGDKGSLEDGIHGGNLIDLQNLTGVTGRNPGDLAGLTNLADRVNLPDLTDDRS